MGYISFNKGKWIYPVPWKTGVHFSQKRLQEFIGPEGIKEEMKLSILKPSTKTFPLMSGGTVTIPITGGKQTKSECTPRYSAGQKPCDEPSVTFKDVLKTIDEPMDYFKYQEEQAKAERKAEREAIQETKRIPVVDFYYTTSYLKQINKVLPKKPKMKKSIPVITSEPEEIIPKKKNKSLLITLSPLNIYRALTQPKTSIAKPPKQSPLKDEVIISNTGTKPTGMSEAGLEISEPIIAPQKPSYLKSKLEPIVTSNLPESLLKVSIALLVILIPLGFITVGGFIFTALFMPEWIVGGVEYVPKTSNLTAINDTMNPQTFNTTPTINPNNPGNQPTPVYQQPAPIIVNPGSTTQPKPIVVNPGSSVNPPSTPTVPTTPTTTTFKDSKGKVRNINELSSQYTWQINYQCYWDLRDKGFGKGLDVEYACNSQDTGLWIEACTCCAKIGRC